MAENHREIDILRDNLSAKDEEIARLKVLIRERDRQLMQLHEDKIASERHNAGIVEGLQKTFEDSDKRHAGSVESLPSHFEGLRKTINGLQKTFEDRMNSLELAARKNQGYVSTVATTVIDLAKGVVERLTDRKRPSAGICPPAKRSRLGDCDTVTSPMTNNEDEDDVFYDAVSTNYNTAPSTAPSTAPAKRQHLEAARVSFSPIPAPHADNNATINLGDDDEIVEDNNSNNNGLVEDDESSVENLDKLQAYDADGNLKRWDELSTTVQDEVRTFLSTRSRAGLYGSVGWYGKVTRSHGKHCINQAKTANHITSHTAVACKTCAHQHLFCVSKVADNTLALRPLCALDRNACNNPDIDSVDFFRLPEDIQAPSKKAKAAQYGKVNNRS